MEEKRETRKWQPNNSASDRHKPAEKQKVYEDVWDATGDGDSDEEKANQWREKEETSRTRDDEDDDTSASEWQDGTSWLTLITQLRPLRRPSRLIESISTVDGAVGQFWQARPNRGAKDEGPFYDSRSGKRGPEIDLIDAFDHSTPAATLFWNSNSSVHCKLWMFAAFTEKQKRFIWYEQ